MPLPSPDAPSDNSTQPSLFALMRAEFTVAKRRKKISWLWDAGAMGLALAAAYLPSSELVVLFGIASFGCKLAAKSQQSRARSAFRLAERVRRYDFQSKSLGWAVPSHEKADATYSFSTQASALARETEASENNYYAIEGPPSPYRALANLVESAFWQEKLCGFMAEARRTYLVYSIACAIMSLTGALILGSSQSLGATLIKSLSIFAAMLVSLDLYGEMRAFDRSAKELRHVITSGHALLTRSRPKIEDALRLMIDYNCLLIECPLIPDSVKEKKAGAISAAWSIFQEGLRSTQGSS